MTGQNEFEAFWAAYPRRVAKLAAQKAYAKALKLTTHETIMRGVERYKAGKPDYADWCHPATWLHGGRWDDEYGEVCGQKTDWWERTESARKLASEKLRVVK
jgi:hypothetical protein